MEDDKPVELEEPDVVPSGSLEFLKKHAGIKDLSHEIQFNDGLDDE